MLGFAGIWHPEHHEIPLTALTEGLDSVPEDVAGRLGFSPKRLKELLSTFRGRAVLLGDREAVLDPSGVTKPYSEQDFLDLCVTLQAEAEWERPVDEGELAISRPAPREVD